VLAVAFGTARAAAPQRTTLGTIGPFAVEAAGGQQRDRQTDNQDPDPAKRLTVNNRSTYHGTFTARFTVDPAGNVRGSGSGSYDAAVWHLEGINGANGGFSCDPAITTTNFTVSVSGRVDNGKLRIRFALADAQERNDDYDCGAGFTGFATTSTYLPESLVAVQDALPEKTIVAAITSPSVGALTARNVENLTDGTRTVESNWTIRITAPTPLEDTTNGGGRGPSPGSVRNPNDPKAEICTLRGTPRNDRLTGTAGNDVICGFGGKDKIYARGGEDTVYAGFGDDAVTGGSGEDVLYGDSGRDLLAARDGARDLVDGGVGRDRGRLDKGRDRLRSVEQT
jgi:Ca2+-binding RTX toxin-like protein